jgi:septum formation protein
VPGLAAWRVRARDAEQPRSRLGLPGVRGARDRALVPGRARVAPTLVLASTSPQRRAILTQLRIPFEVVSPSFDESTVGDPLARAAGKARSVDGAGRVVLGVDTEVLLDGELLGKAADADQAATMLRGLAGRDHQVVSGLCLRTREWEELRTSATLVTFRELSDAAIATYVDSGEWKDRAGAYAIQGLGAGLVERIEGDFLNVVGLPGAVLLRVLGERFPGAYAL